MTRHKGEFRTDVKGTYHTLDPEEDWVIILEDKEFAFRKRDLTYIEQQYNDGHEPEVIAKELKRDEWEVLFVLCHLAIKGRNIRVFAERKRVMSA
ncbi:hypothetical protein [Alkalibacillus salilacus]|uniref:Stalled ribosome rescue protein Dom34 n=1 Tax=Alkalibacillus salilacus TaxID=284582 RepID=A0ABT9VDF8_9BACI|nr:hypothetical protein [Alkalibacillus salilacus]MDQ0158998.1 stalled ribosome rescue protein Dom34 [Alkalibacillus salilacus]